MNSQAVQNEINSIIEANRRRIGGRAARNQARIAKHQIVTLTELGILDIVPNAPYCKFIGHSDAKAVIEAAQEKPGTVTMSFKYQAGMDDDPNVYSSGSTLYRLLNEPETVEDEANEYTINLDGDGGSQNMTSGVEAFHSGTRAGIFKGEDGWFYVLDGVGDTGLYWEGEDVGPFDSAKEAEQAARDSFAEVESY